MNDLNPGRIHSRWRRLIFKAILFCLAIYDLYKPRRAKIHWIGRRSRPRRLERALGLFVFCGGFIFLEWHEYMIWSAWWGSMASAFVIWRSVRILVPRKQYHWVNYRKGR